MEFKKMNKKIGKGSKQENQNKTKGAFKFFCLCLAAVFLFAPLLFAQQDQGDNGSADNGVNEHVKQGVVSCQIPTGIELLAYEAENFNVCKWFVESYNLCLSVDRNAQLIQLLSNGEVGDLFFGFEEDGDLSPQDFKDARFNEIEELASALVRAAERAVECWDKLWNEFFSIVRQRIPGVRKAKCSNVRQYERSLVSIAIDEAGEADLTQTNSNSYKKVFPEEGNGDFLPMLEKIENKTQQAEEELEKKRSLRNRYTQK